MGAARGNPGGAGWRRILDLQVTTREGRSHRISAVLLRAGLLLLATAAILALAALGLWHSDFGRQALADLLARSQPGGVLLGILVISLATPITAARWRCLLPEPVASRGSLWLLTQIQCVAVLFNYAVPGPVGELVAALLVKRRYGIGASEALAASMVARLVGLAVAAFMAAFIFLVAPLPIPDNWRQAALAAAVAMLLGAGALALAAARPRQLQTLMARSGGPVERRGGRLGQLTARGRGMADKLLLALAAISKRGPKPLLKATAWTTVGHVISPTGVAIAAWSMGMAPAWAGVVFTNVFVIVSALALYLFPGSQVGWDVMYCTVFTGSTGVSLADAAAVTVLARVQQSLLVLLGALALLFLARHIGQEAAARRKRG